MNYINKMQRDCQIDENTPLFEQLQEDKTPQLQIVSVLIKVGDRGMAVKKAEGYFFTQEELTKYIAEKQREAAEKALDEYYDHLITQEDIDKYLNTNYPKQ